MPLLRLAGRRAQAPIAQDASLATKARRLEKNDGLVDWSRSAAEIHNQVRALQPWPKTFSFLQRATVPGEPLRVILDRVAVCEGPTLEAAPGTIVVVEPSRLTVATGREFLRIDKLQPQGKRVLAAQEFINGYGPKVGDRFVAAPGGV